MAKDSRTRYLTEVLRGYDSKLYAERVHGGVIYIYREGSVMVPFEYEGQKYLAVQSSPRFIVALTENWSIRGRPVEWGADLLLEKLKSIDSWNKGVTVDELIESYEKADQSKQRDIKNQAEAFFSDARSAFKKDFSDINTSNMNVKEESIKRGI